MPLIYRKLGHINAMKLAFIFVQAVRLASVHSVKHIDIRNKSLLSKAFLLFRNTKSPARIAMIPVGICE